MQERHNRSAKELRTLPTAYCRRGRAVERFAHAAAEVRVGRIDWVKHAVVNAALHLCSLLN